VHDEYIAGLYSYGIGRDEIDMVQSGDITADGYVSRYHVSGLGIMEHHASSDNVSFLESGLIYTNLGAGGTIVFNLPQSAPKGTYFDFVLMVAQILRIDPGAGGGIYINGAKQTDDHYIWADDEGESLRTISDGNGDWVALYTQGTWGVEE
jgi:hypothetical protein